MGPHTSDSYTSRTMSMARSGAMTPNSTPTGALQKGPARQLQKSGGGANTPNSTPSVGPLQKTNRNYGEPLVTGYPMVPQVENLTGIPHRDPNLGGPGQTQKSDPTGGKVKTSSNMNAKISY
jgi:hypothetical protein